MPTILEHEQPSPWPAAAEEGRGEGRQGRGLCRPRLAGALLALGLALAGCGGDSALRLVTAPSEPADSSAAQVAPPNASRAATDSTQVKSPSASVAAAAGPSSAAGASTSTSTTGSSRVGAGVGVGSSGGPGGGTKIGGTLGATPAAGQAPAASRAVPGGARLEIPSIGVDASIVSLGVNSDGIMQVPDNGKDVGWYTFSAPPGAPGNAVLSGHLDTATSPTAVFTRLKDLKQGDALTIAEDGKSIDYRVFWTKAWADDTAPLALILGNAPSPTLTLITCAGTFDRVSRNYNQRLVVRAKLPGTV